LIGEIFFKKLPQDAAVSRSADAPRAPSKEKRENFTNHLELLYQKPGFFNNTVAKKAVWIPREHNPYRL
jgi:hypothetical protein